MSIAPSVRNLQQLRTILETQLLLLENKNQRDQLFDDLQERSVATMEVLETYQRGKDPAKYQQITAMVGELEALVTKIENWPPLPIPAEVTPDQFTLLVQEVNAVTDLESCNVEELQANTRKEITKLSLPTTMGGPALGAHIQQVRQEALELEEIEKWSLQAARQMIDHMRTYFNGPAEPIPETVEPVVTNSVQAPPPAPRRSWRQSLLALFRR